MFSGYRRSTPTQLGLETRRTSHRVSFDLRGDFPFPRGVRRPSAYISRWSFRNFSRDAGERSPRWNPNSSLLFVIRRLIAARVSRLATAICVSLLKCAGSKSGRVRESKVANRLPMASKVSRGVMPFRRGMTNRAIPPNTSSAMAIRSWPASSGDGSPRLVATASKKSSGVLCGMLAWRCPLWRCSPNSRRSWVKSRLCSWESSTENAWSLTLRARRQRG